MNTCTHACKTWVREVKEEAELYRGESTLSPIGRGLVLRGVSREQGHLSYFDKCLFAVICLHFHSSHISDRVVSDVRRGAEDVHVGKEDKSIF